MKYETIRSLFILTICALFPLAAFADGSDSAESSPAEDWTVNDHKPTASDASFDKRLPPVLPGEEITDGKHTIKVWSTAGSVPTSEAPDPWKKAPPAGVGVIVDGRTDAKIPELRNPPSNSR